MFNIANTVRWHIVALVAVGLLVSIAAACGDGDDESGDGNGGNGNGGGPAAPDPADSPSDDGVAEIGETTYEFAVTQCVVGGGNYSLLATGTAPDDRLVDVIITGTEERAGINVRIGGDGMGGEPDSEFSMAPSSGPANTLRLNPDVFSLSAKGTFTDLKSETLESAEGTIQVSCAP